VAWLNPDPKDLDAMYAILDDRERPYYEHRLAAQLRNSANTNVRNRICSSIFVVFITFLDNKESDARAPSVPRRAKSQRLERDLTSLPCSMQTWDRND
jgi:hypothetical protein